MKINSWGYNAHSQLGDGTFNTGRTPVAVNLPNGRTARAVSTSSFHTCAILDNGTLHCWGNNSYGQLGDDSTTSQGSPTEVAFSDNKTALAVSSGNRHTCAILSDDSLVCWGYNNNGQLGVARDDSELCTVSGTRYACIKTPAEVNVGTDRSAKAVAPGDQHTCALLDDGSVKCWGRNDYGQLGNGNGEASLTPVAVALPAGKTAVAIYTALDNTCAVLDDNSVWCWGANNYGQLLDGTTIDRHTPVRARL